MSMGKEFPCRSAGTVVFPNRPPSPLAEIRPPTFPMFFTSMGFGQSDFFLCHKSPITRITPIFTKARPFSHVKHEVCEWPADAWQDESLRPQFVGQSLFVLHFHFAR